MSKFVYDKHKMSFRRSRLSVAGFFLKALKYLSISVLMALACYVVFAIFFDTDKEKKLIQENESLAEEYAQLQEKLEMVDGVISDLVVRDRTIYNDVFNSDPPRPGVGLIDSVTFDPVRLYSMHEDDIIWDTYAFAGKISSKLSNVSNWIVNIEGNLKEKGERVKYIPAIVPIKNFTVMQTGASTGPKYNPFIKAQKEHTGIDIMAPVGTDVLSSACGIVVSVEKAKKGLGNKITIDHGDGLQTTYSHLSQMMVARGRKVGRGDIIGRVGNSGASFAPCLHYEVIRNGEYQDPVNYFFADLTPEQYREMTIIARTTGQSMD